MTTCDGSCPLLDAAVEKEEERSFGQSDYEGATARWCPGCGDHSVLLLA